MELACSQIFCVTFLLAVSLDALFHFGTPSLAEAVARLYQLSLESAGFQFFWRLGGGTHFLLCAVVLRAAFRTFVFLGTTPQALDTPLMDKCKAKLVLFVGCPLSHKGKLTFFLSE